MLIAAYYTCFIMLSALWLCKFGAYTTHSQVLLFCWANFKPTLLITVRTEYCIKLSIIQYAYCR